ncbi:hypothetical protein [Enterococcus faecalis]|uniref:hypothetical protein n=1 Tax=Enterococcus faecalis TaxID=1351 RepID=UPI00155EE85C|nr:hypothetical protein [Enterococcus faecalis]
MKNRKQIKFGILIAVISVAIIGTIGVKKMNEPTEKEKQIAFLKEHEEEMTEYVKQQNEKIAKVAFCWESLEKESVGNGLPQGAGDILSIRIQIIDNNNNKINSFGLAIKPNNWNEPTKIKELYTINADYDYYTEGG